MSKEIEQEVRERVNFKLEELLSGMREAAKRNWHMAFQTGNPKYSHYWEAFEEMVKMVEKERAMPLPYDEMYLQKKREAKDKAVEEISALIVRRGEHPSSERSIIRSIVSSIQKCQI